MQVNNGGGIDQAFKAIDARSTGAKAKDGTLNASDVATVFKAEYAQVKASLQRQEAKHLWGDKATPEQIAMIEPSFQDVLHAWVEQQIPDAPAGAGAADVEAVRKARGTLTIAAGDYVAFDRKANAPQIVGQQDAYFHEALPAPKLPAEQVVNPALNFAKAESTRAGRD